jgi:diguanylate cyclase (GGDEF)-like protein
MARLSAESPQERDRLEMLLRASTPRTSSVRLALSFTTKVTMLMQRQNELEMATNRISSAISNTLETEPMLQSAVEEVGRVLNARRAAIVLWQEGSNLPEGMTVYERPQESQGYADEVKSLISTSERGASNGPQNETDHISQAAEQHGLSVTSEKNAGMTGPLEVPISYQNNVIGVLVVEDDTTFRSWEDEEVLMVKTASDQLSVAISHARLFRQVQNQAITDALTGLHNHRYFQQCLERETELADRNKDQVSLILLDLDHLKRVNDTYGHRSGDAVLCHVAAMMKSVVRKIDVCARYGGEEFAVLLPQCPSESAVEVAKRLGYSIASKPVPIVGQVTASIGVATYPSDARNKDELIEIADRAMYLAKSAGRNCIRTSTHAGHMGTDVR